MAIPEDLLAQAKHLANREPKRPRQASLRRAVSTAYYALFHLLVTAGANAIAPNKPAELRNRVRRAFTHEGMKEASAGFQHGNIENLPNGIKSLIASPIQPELSIVANAFIQLQQDRNTADYDFSRTLTRAEVLSKIDLVDRAFDAWAKVKQTDNANVFLTALLLHRNWRPSR